MTTELTPIAHTPTSIADAIAVHARLGALADWTAERKRAVAGWVDGRAQTRLAEDGAAPTWRTDVGTALLTDPKPKASIVDVDTFARWYVREVRGEDPDVEAVGPSGPSARVAFGDAAVRETSATVPSDVLLAFLHDWTAASAAHPDRRADTYPAAVAPLVAAIDVSARWTLSGTLLDDLIDGKVGAVGSGHPRIVVDGETLAAIDLITGEVVPGVAVNPPTRRAVQMRPTPQCKRQVRAELDSLLGTPQLED